MPYQPTVCVDFDGVIHSYTTSWAGPTVIPDPPVEGAFKWLAQLVAAGFKVCIFSSRSHRQGGIEAMQDWFQKHNIEGWVFQLLHFPLDKPSAVLYVDDRGFCFEGSFPSVDFINHFKPWNKR